MVRLDKLLSQNLLTPTLDGLSHWTATPRPLCQVGVCAAGLYAGYKWTIEPVRKDSSGSYALDQVHALQKAMRNLSTLVAVWAKQAEAFEKSNSLADKQDLGEKLKKTTNSLSKVKEAFIEKTYTHNPERRLYEKKRPELTIVSQKAIAFFREKRADLRDILSSGKAPFATSVNLWIDEELHKLSCPEQETCVDPQRIMNVYSTIQEMQKQYARYQQQMDNATENYLKEHSFTYFEAGASFMRSIAGGLVATIGLEALVS